MSEREGFSQSTDLEPIGVTCSSCGSHSGNPITSEWWILHTSPGHTFHHFVRRLLTRILPVKRQCAVGCTSMHWNHSQRHTYHDGSHSTFCPCHSVRP